MCYNIEKLRDNNKNTQKEVIDMMNVKVKVYNGVKYYRNSEKVAEVEYNNIKGYE